MFSINLTGKVEFDLHLFILQGNLCGSEGDFGILGYFWTGYSERQEESRGVLVPVIFGINLRRRTLLLLGLSLLLLLLCRLCGLLLLLLGLLLLPFFLGHVGCVVDTPNGSAIVDFHLHFPLQEVDIVESLRKPLGMRFLLGEFLLGSHDYFLGLVELNHCFLILLVQEQSFAQH